MEGTATIAAATDTSITAIAARLCHWELTLP
jgi:hypothetical protein